MVYGGSLCNFVMQELLFGMYVPVVCICLNGDRRFFLNSSDAGRERGEFNRVDS